MTASACLQGGVWLVWTQTLIIGSMDGYRPKQGQHLSRTPPNEPLSVSTGTDPAGCRSCRTLLLCHKAFQAGSSNGEDLRQHLLFQGVQISFLHLFQTLQ